MPTVLKDSPYGFVFFRAFPQSGKNMLSERLHPRLWDAFLARLLPFSDTCHIGKY